jgi:Domain of unknown function (DUF5076)
MSEHDHNHHAHEHHDHSHDIHPHQLMPPHEVFHDPKAGELVRAWITNGHLSLSLHAMAFGKADVWGHVLAGIAEQVAASCAEMGHGNTSGNLEDIRKALSADLAKAAAKHSPLSVKS